MLQITIPAIESWDEENNVFVTVEKEKTLQLEHSLISLAKWESKWRKPFISKIAKTDEEAIDYIRCMTITPNVNPEVYDRLTVQNLKSVDEYIGNPMTATTFSDSNKGKPNREIVTAEIIYYWMIALGIPSEYRKWHLNSLLTLIQVCNIKNAPSKKMSKHETMRSNAALNAARRQRLNSKG